MRHFGGSSADLAQSSADATSLTTAVSPVTDHGRSPASALPVAVAVGLSPVHLSTGPSQSIIPDDASGENSRVNSDSFILSIQSLRHISENVQNAVLTSSPFADRTSGIPDTGTMLAKGTIDAHIGTAISYDSHSDAVLDSHHGLIALVPNHGAIDPSGMLFS